MSERQILVVRLFIPCTGLKYWTSVADIFTCRGVVLERKSDVSSWLLLCVSPSSFGGMVENGTCSTGRWLTSWAFVSRLVDDSLLIFRGSYNGRFVFTWLFHFTSSAQLFFNGSTTSDLDFHWFLGNLSGQSSDSFLHC